MKIVCSSNMPYVEEAFSGLGEVMLRDGRAITAADVKDAELLAIRSTTPVNADLLNGSRVRFVGTATIGTDHMDLDYLRSRGIRWCHAPGCNANSVAEYITAAVLTLAGKRGGRCSEMTIGIVGVGNVGREVAVKARALGMRVLLNDPPRERAEKEISAEAPFVGIDRILAESDIVTLHVPLTRTGPDATYHMAGRDFFEAMRDGAILINAARGAVVDSEALRTAMAEGKPAHLVLDTWEGEPAVPRDLVRAADIGSPHIAGYSFDGKVMGTVMVYQDACRFLGEKPKWRPDAVLADPPVPVITLEGDEGPVEDELRRAVGAVYDILRDDAALRRLAEDGEGTVDAGAFDALRKSYRVRREFPFTTCRLRRARPELEQALSGLGFNTYHAAEKG